MIIYELGGSGLKAKTASSAGTWHEHGRGRPRQSRRRRGRRGEHEETASDLKVPLIVFPREKGPKVALRIAEEISQHITIL